MLELLHKMQSVFHNGCFLSAIADTNKQALPMENGMDIHDFAE